MTAQDTAQARKNMILQQIRPWDVTHEGVLGVMGELPRELFVGDAYRGLAYADVEIPLTADEAMLAPRIVARALQAVDPKPGDDLLVIGTGSGYLPAVAAQMGAQVVSYDLHRDLTEAAQARIDQLDLRNCKLRTGDALAQPPGDGPFDAIVLTGALPVYLPALEQLLKVGGRLFVVVGEAPAMQAMRVTRTEQSQFVSENLFETVLPPMQNAPRPEAFVF